MEKSHEEFIDMAVSLAFEGMRSGLGGPFGAVVVKDGKVIGRGCNNVTSDNDPTAHAEIVAIRDACKKMKNFQLEDCIIYSSCEPCPMCLGAIYWARPKAIYFALSRKDAADINFDDDFIYMELSKSLDERRIPTRQIKNPNALKLFKAWEKKEDKTVY